MRPPCVRFTILRMMVVVAIVGLVCSEEVMRRRQAHYLVKAVYHDGKQTSPFGRGVYLVNSIQDHSKMRQQSAEWHGQLKLKYMRAARYPWLPIAPDPPSPPEPKRIPSGASGER
jgi:hypothetical protein